MSMSDYLQKSMIENSIVRLLKENKIDGLTSKHIEYITKELYSFVDAMNEIEKFDDKMVFMMDVFVVLLAKIIEGTLEDE